MLARMFRPWSGVSIACAAIFSLCGGVFAQAQVNSQTSGTTKLEAFSVSPLRFDFGGEQQSEKLLLTNPNSHSIAVQIRIFEWLQIDGRDVYAPSIELEVSPSIASINPGATKVFHLQRRSVRGSTERRYRLVIDQLPSEQRPKAGAATRLQISIPVFLDAPADQAPKLATTIESEALHITNEANVTDIIRSVELRSIDGGEQVTIDTSSGRYIHGQSVKTYIIPRSFECSRHSFVEVSIVAGVNPRHEIQQIPCL